MRRTFRLGVWSFYFLVVPPGMAMAWEKVQEQGPASLHVHAGELSEGRAEVRLSAQIRITIRLEGVPNLIVEPIQKITTSRDWQQTNTTVPALSSLGPDKVRWEQSFFLFPTRPGNLSLEVAPLRYRETPGDAPWIEVRWHAEEMHVITEIMRPDLSELRNDIRPEELPPLPSRRSFWLGVGVAALFVVLSLAGWSLYRRQRRPSAEVPPDSWVEAELARVAGLPLQTAEEVEHFHVRIADAVRRYLQLRYGLLALEQTTSELLEAPARSPGLRLPAPELIQEILERCDVVKFARAQPSPEQCRELLQTARRFVGEATSAAALGKEGHDT